MAKKSKRLTKAITEAECSRISGRMVTIKQDRKFVGFGPLDRDGKIARWELYVDGNKRENFSELSKIIDYFNGKEISGKSIPACGEDLVDCLPYGC